MTTFMHRNAPFLPRNILGTIALAALLAAAAPAQASFTYDVTSPGFVEQQYLDSATYPDGALSAVPGPGLPTPNAMALPAAAFPGGGIASDDVGTTLFTTDGFLLAVDTNPAYLAVTPPLPPTPPVAIAFPPGFGPLVTGMGCDSTGGVLWMSDPFGVAPFSSTPPYAPLGPPFPVPGAGIAPIVGLGHEPSTGTLWAVDAAGAVYHFMPGGAPVGPQPVTTVVSIPGFLFNGLDVNTTNGPGSFPSPACSLQTGSQHVVVTDGVFLYDAVPGIAAAIPLAAGSGFGVVGVACSSDYQVVPGFVGCPASGAAPAVLSLAPNSTGPVSPPNGVVMVGGPPLAPVFVAADVCPVPGGAMTVGGEVLWISPFSPSAVIGIIGTDAVGSVLIPLPWAFVPAGLQLTVQFAIPDALAPFAACLTDAATITTGLP